MSYRNREGYSDPTAGQAMGNITREEHRRRRQIREASDDWIRGAGERHRPAGREGLPNSAEDAETASDQPGSNG